MSDVDKVAEAFEAILPLLAGLPPQEQGAILADLLATWLVGHSIGNPKATARLRRDLLNHHVAVVRKLVPVNEDIMRRRRRAEETRAALQAAAEKVDEERAKNSPEPQRVRGSLSMPSGRRDRGGAPTTST
jgi:hypothetical protein